MLQEFKDNELWKVRTPLCDIMEEERSDKSTGHNYTTLYNHLFKDLKDENINLVEIGLGTNNPNVPSNMSINGTPKASVRGWRRYFTRNNIYGCDVDKGILQDENRIKTHFIDQLDLNTIRDFKNNFEEGFKFDIIIDDGLHTHEANINLFKYMNDILRVGGLYIIEDLNKEVNEKVLLFLEDYKEHFEIDDITLPHANTHDNRMVVLRKKKEFLSFENDLSELIHSTKQDNDIKKYFTYTIHKKNHNKEKVFSLSLFNKDIDQQEGEARDNIQFETKYKESLLKLIPLINETGYGINLFTEERYKDLIDNENVNVYSFNHSYGALGMYWRFLSVDLVEESIICDIDLNNINIHKLFFNIDTSCRLVHHGIHDYYIDVNKTSKKYSSILGSTIKFLKKDFDFNMKNAIINFLTYQKNEDLTKERQNIFNKGVGIHKYGFGNCWLVYGSDERFLAKVIYFYLTKKGKLTSFYTDFNNYESKEDINYCKNLNNKILTL
jgi:SAM-dependent methyltransferase